MPPVDDYYARLGVSRSAGAAELRRAYRLLALRWHPDRAGPSATERFQRISEAYQVLADASARAAYDGRLRAQDDPGQHVPDQRDFAGYGGRVTMTWRPTRRPGPRLPRLSGALAELIAAGAARQSSDGTIELLATAAELAAGGLGVIDAPLPVTCPTCAGVARRNRVWCRRCEYAGEVVDQVRLMIDVPAGTADGTLFSFDHDPGGTHPPVRVRIRIR
jgi:molecular chaperone DnaJ